MKQQQLEEQYQQQDNQGISGTEPYPLEQRYIDAINDFQRISPRSRPSPIRTAFNTPSVCSSSKSNSLDSHTTDLVHESLPFHGHIFGLGRRSTMHRAHNSPLIIDKNTSKTTSETIN